MVAAKKPKHARSASIEGHRPHRSLGIHRPHQAIRRLRYFGLLGEASVIMAFFKRQPLMEQRNLSTWVSADVDVAFRKYDSAWYVQKLRAALNTNPIVSQHPFIRLAAAIDCDTLDRFLVPSLEVTLPTNGAFGCLKQKEMSIRASIGMRFQSMTSRFK